MRIALRFAVVSVAALSIAACDANETLVPAPDASTQAEEPKPLPELERAPLTTERILKPAHEVDESASLNPLFPEQLTQLIDEGYGEVKEESGEPILERTLDDSDPPAPGAGRKLLTRFVHLADIQLADDESPLRLAARDLPLLGGGFRPQEGYECRILHAAVRTVNAVHRTTPIDFLLLGGDNADNAQSNEVDWVQQILEGGDPVECDSGDDNDIVPGGNNDPKDPFIAEGLDVPWWWVTGNHDILVNGFSVVNEARSAEVLGTLSANGTRDYTQPGAPAIIGDVVADPRRKLVTRASLMEQLRDFGDGHGITAAVAKTGKANYTFDAGDVRIVVVDTAAETGSQDGVVHQSDVDGFLKPALDKAKADGKWVIVTSHHISRSLSDGSSFGGELQPDALTPEAWRELLGSYDNLLMHLAAHSHIHRVDKAEVVNGKPYWEVQTAALADFPHQMRVIEIWDEANGYLTIRGVPLDYATADDPIAADGRTRGVIDMTSGWIKDDRGEPKDRNVDLWVEKPAVRR